MINKKTALMITLISTPFAATAECPKLDDVVPVLPTIADKLRNKNQQPLAIKGQLHTVHYGDSGKAVDDILAGHFQGHSIHRLQETETGVCEYLLTDDNTPARGSFILRANGNL